MVGEFKQKKVTSCNFSAVLLWPSVHERGGRHCSPGGAGVWGEGLVLFFVSFFFPSDTILLGLGDRSKDTSLR